MQREDGNRTDGVKQLPEQARSEVGVAGLLRLVFALTYGEQRSLGLHGNMPAGCYLLTCYLPIGFIVG